jgi:hypothetical protein
MFLDIRCSLSLVPFELLHIFISYRVEIRSSCNCREFDYKVSEVPFTLHLPKQYTLFLQKLFDFSTKIEVVCECRMDICLREVRECIADFISASQISSAFMPSL